MVWRLWVRRVATHESNVDESGPNVDEPVQIEDVRHQAWWMKYEDESRASVKPSNRSHRAAFAVQVSPQRPRVIHRIWALIHESSLRQR
jgi:hypothetical protein